MRFKACLTALLVTFLTVGPVLSAHAASPSVVISELLTGTEASASQEFVELYNPTDNPISVDGWSLEYKSATSADQPEAWSTRASLIGQIKAHGFYLISPHTYLSQAEVNLSPGLAASGGHIRLVDNGGGVIDLVGWGTANLPETAAAPAPASGQSLERLPGPLVEEGGNWIDSDNNAADFKVRSAPTPQTGSAAIETPFRGELPADPPPVGSDPTGNPGSAAIEITELLIDPVAPATDASDEFIEVFNPTGQEVNLANYKLKTGSNFHDSYTLPDLEIGAGQYLALYSRQTKLGLTNAGGSAQLLSPSGQLVDQVPNYDKAQPGQSWAKFADGWDWTTQLTPGGLNVYLAGATSQSKATKTKTSKAKAAATGAASRKAAAGAKAKVAAAAKKAKSLAAGLTSPLADTSDGTRWLLIIAGGLTIGYAIYEYRHNLQNYFYLARRKLGFGPKDRPTASGRGSR